MANNIVSNDNEGLGFPIILFLNSVFMLHLVTNSRAFDISNKAIQSVCRFLFFFNIMHLPFWILETRKKNFAHRIDYCYYGWN